MCCTSSRCRPWQGHRRLCQRAAHELIRYIRTCLSGRPASSFLSSRSSACMPSLETGMHEQKIVKAVRAWSCRSSRTYTALHALKNSAARSASPAPGSCSPDARYMPAHMHGLLVVKTQKLVSQTTGAGKLCCMPMQASASSKLKQWHTFAPGPGSPSTVQVLPFGSSGAVCSVIELSGLCCWPG